MIAVAPTSWFTALFGLYVAWRIYRRCRQHVGRQEWKTRTIILRIMVYCLLSGGFAIMTLGGSGLFTAWSAGLLTGLSVACYGLYLTRFEFVPEGRFFTPNPWLNLTMSMIFIGRLVYRVAKMDGVSLKNWTYTGILQTPLTMYVFELVASYFAVYYMGVLIRCHSHRVTPAMQPGPSESV
jgi:hypothetical protein